MKLTKLEAFVWNNPHATFEELARATNRPLSALERAYDRAKKKTQKAHVELVFGKTGTKTA